MTEPPEAILKSLNKTAEDEADVEFLGMKLLKQLNLNSLSSYEMWDISFFQCVLMITFSPILILIAWKPIPEIAYVYIVTFFVGLTSLWLILIFRHSKSTTLSSVVYVFNAVIAAVGVLINQNSWIQSDLHFHAFAGFKLVAFIVAFQAPPKKWVGWSCLILFFFAPLVQYILWSPVERELIGIQEPWITLLPVLCAGFLYAHRLQFYEHLQKKDRLEASEQEMRKYAHILLSAQHLINTPLQVISTTAEMIRMQHPETQPWVQKIQNAFLPIREINQLLAFGKDWVVWKDIKLPSNIQELETEIKACFPDAKINLQVQNESGIQTQSNVKTQESNVLRTPNRLFFY